uniref:VLTF3-like protein n=1 Tax=Marseillevirus LCMAC101 TaxID=2506602 RepID=A0A481YRM8_9VIRU|nr:MAG: VLTF3-like protein [Marseillevirus LCMAC101]
MYTYRAVDHFKQTLGRFQGVSPQYVPENVVCEVHQKLLDMKCDLITPITVKTALSRLKYSKYYKYSYFIAERLGWVNPTKNLDQEYLITEFIKIREVFTDAAPKDRMNFSPFSVVTYKIIEKYPNISSEERTVILDLLFESLPRIYKEWINPKLLESYDFEFILLRSVQISEIQELWDKIEKQLSDVSLSNN